MTGGSASGANGTPIPSLSASEDAVEAGAKAMCANLSRLGWERESDRERQRYVAVSHTCLYAALIIERERWEAEAVARIEALAANWETRCEENIGNPIWYRASEELRAAISTLKGTK